MNILIAVLIFSIIIIVHELGHFLMAKANHIVVTEFALGLGPVILSTEKGGTRYALKLLPFGGSCSMLGEDEDESGEGSFNSKSIPARISVILGGPVFNLLLALILSIIIISLAGIDHSYVTEVTKDSPAAEAGLKEGDIITRFEGSGISFSRELSTKLQLDGTPTDEINMTVKRDGKKHTITYKPETESKYMLGYSYYPDSEKAEVASLSIGSAMQKSGIEVGDIIVSIDGNAVDTGEDLANYFTEHPMDGSDIKIVYLQNNKEKETTVTPKVTKLADLGFVYNMAREKVGPIRTLGDSVMEVKYWVKTTIKSIQMLVTGQFSVNDLSGPVGVVSAIGDTIEASSSDGAYYVFLNLMNFAIMLTANLGIMNLLPFPALDGGRFWFLLVEGIRGKSINRRVEGAINFTGFMLLIALMVFVMFNDIRKLF